MTDTPSNSHYTLERPEEAINPQAIYRDLRDNTPVVYLSGRSTTGTLTISRHEDVMAALRTPELFSSDSAAVQIGNTRPLVPLQVDPPHTASTARRSTRCSPPSRWSSTSPGCAS